MDTQAPRRERLAFLDFARGIAALMVLFAHGLAQCLPGYLDWALANVELGRVGVIVFLMISGFIIPASLEQGGSLDRFWLRRFFRLFPAYWFSIALAFAYLLLGGREPLAVTLDDGATWLVNLTMLQGFFGMNHVWGVFWTLHLELIIYLACSLLFACGLLRRISWSVGMALVLSYLLIGLPRPLLMGKPYLPNAFRIEYLFVAPLIGLIAQRYWSGRITRRQFYLFVVAQPLAILFVWGVNKVLYPDAEIRGFFTVGLTWGIAYVVFLVFLEMKTLTMPRWGLWLGRVSYSVYLFHPLVLTLLLAVGCPSWLLLLALLSGTLILSAVTYYAVEEPGIQLGRWVERRLFPPKPQPTPQPTLAKAA